MGGKKRKKKELAAAWIVRCVPCNRSMTVREQPHVIRCSKCETVSTWERKHQLPDKSVEKKQPRMTHAQYEDYINSPAWKKLRAAKYKDAGRTCNDCGSHRLLTVHHLTYDRLGRERLADLEVLCVNCHKDRHAVAGMNDFLWGT